MAAIWIAYEINNNRHPFKGVRAARLFGYLMITYFIAAIIFLYYPMISTGLAGFWAPKIH
jgi:hypothetical protein